MITLLAIIGESSVAEHAQTLTASSLCLLPRIIPAPQALLRPVRPQRLPEVTAKMAGVYGGVVLDTVGFFANIMHPLEDLRPFSFRVLKISHNHGAVGMVPPVSAAAAGKANGKGNGKGEGRLSGFGEWLLSRWRRRKGKGTGVADGAGAGAGAGAAAAQGGGGRGKAKGTQQTVHFSLEDPERGISSSAEVDPAPGVAPRRTGTMSERITDMLTNPTMINSEQRYTVPPAYYSPVHILSVVSFLLTIGIVIAAIFWNDGTAILAICLISLASSVVCYASLWRPILMNRRTTNKVPRGDVVIRTRVGAFILIKCTEEVARELYSGTEECRYVSAEYHRIFMGLGMVLLMVAVVLLGNCGWNSQVFIGASYILLNGLYWLMGLLPQRYFWDLSRYEVQDVTPEDAQRADETTDPNDPREGAPSFTRTLWYAVRETKYGAWVERSGALPGTDQWKDWLKEAVDEAWKNNRGWEAVRRKNEIMKESVDASSPTSLRHPFDKAEQHAPLLEVQPPRRKDSQGHGSSTF